MKMEPNLFEHVNYRQFLAAYYQSKKASSESFSYRYFARRAGVASPSYLLDVIKGVKNIADKSLDGFCRALGLSLRERHYFENLVRFNQSDNPEVKRHYYQQLLPVLKKESGKHLQGKQYDYFSSWYLPVVREMIALSDFRENSKWISRRLKGLISPKEAKKAIELLLDLGLIKRNADERLKITDVTVTTPPEVAELVMVKFHQEMLSQAREALVGVEGWQREISGITAALSPAQFKEIKQEIQEFQNRIMQRLEKVDQEANHVYQFNCQLFALTANPKEESHA